MGEMLTKKSQKVLASVHIAQSLACMFTMTGLKLLVDLVELRALESVK